MTSEDSEATPDTQDSFYDYLVEMARQNIKQAGGFPAELTVPLRAAAGWCSPQRSVMDFCEGDESEEGK